MITNSVMKNANTANRLDRLPFSKVHKMALAVLAFAYFFDFCDLNTFSYAAPALVKEWGISTHTIAFITSASYLGMFIGASLGGWFSDRFGRKKALVLMVSIFSFFSLLSAFAWNPTVLGVLRFLTSIGVGATTIIASTYISEFFPSSSRGKYQALCITIGICGIPVAGWVAKTVIPMAPWGWRCIFIFGAIGIFFPFIARKLEESARWYEARGQIDKANEIMKRIEEKVVLEKGELSEPKPMASIQTNIVTSVPYRTLFKQPLLGRTVVLMIMWATSTIAIQGFGTWVPTLLVKQGITIEKSIAYVTLGTIGAPLGALLASQISDRIERKWSITIFSIVIMGLGFLYGWAPLPMVIVICGFLMHMFERTFSSLAYTYSPELYPIEARGSGNGLTYGVGRLANIIGPFVVSFLYSGYGYLSVFLFFGSCWLVCAVTIGVFGAKTRQSNREEVGLVNKEVAM
ncbi:MFS transporter [Aneurinibacillus migulanus]|uniref:MFS transporter n=1 Tax=Aneurinibacillus migulanus TaxID=47500 RepID=UPI002E1F5DD5|nr:MFS transporter [Aneurinibacillus migulanus]